MRASSILDRPSVFESEGIMRKFEVDEGELDVSALPVEQGCKYSHISIITTNVLENAVRRTACAPPHQPHRIGALTSCHPMHDVNPVTLVVSWRLKAPHVQPQTRHKTNTCAPIGYHRKQQKSLKHVQTTLTPQFFS